MSTATSGNPRGQQGNRDRRPQADLPEQVYFGEHPGGIEEGRNEGLKLIIIALVIIGAIAIGLGFLFRSVDKSHNAETTSALAEHNQLMREAMQMAREAQQVNRQRMMEMQRAMQEAEYGAYGEYGEYGEYPGSDDYIYDP